MRGLAIGGRQKDRRDEGANKEPRGCHRRVGGETGSDRYTAGEDKGA